MALLTESSPPPVTQDLRNGWVRLRTLLMLRWLAILGQTVTVVVASFFLGLRIELGLCFLAIGASVLSNMIAMTVFPPSQRLRDVDAMLTLIFDMTQLSFLLFLTGGLNNPFALLILAPVTISATALTLRSTVILGVMSVAMITLVAFYHIPLRQMDGTVLAQPRQILLGFWISIVIGIVFLSVYARRVAQEVQTMNEALLATQEALAREQKLTDLGGAVAAAAHELGTPLATIKLVSTELAEELEGNPELAEDARLIRQQADRCRDILRDMGRAGKDDLHMRSAPLGAVMHEAAEPHEDRGVALHFAFEPVGGEAEQPVIFRRPEIIHGLRNLVQNAVDFAKSDVWIDGAWGDGQIRLKIVDDGEGYPTDLIGRLGDPFLRRRRSGREQSRRPGYEGMGLGLFIAKTLLERSGATVSFRNARDPFLLDEESGARRGAMVEVTWPAAAIQIGDAEAKAPLGVNRRFPA
ncbi:sensor histidine kinase RegB [Alterinioella nitratireducens]|uniref:sensor histidine kinase RegB n=1 Tax=Alterinioella nitratireducens TaxID=2735915 RepID=UPI001552BD86|nr:ActS/PrrB/RegB family redox-sensitive histidine kinase [Alterinioella nitratireducens]NPD20122.1 ActS/PrrB/RegB family redox-sensitive histidine kinase [Alterinioella nitratireducens]